MPRTLRSRVARPVPILGSGWVLPHWAQRALDRPEAAATRRWTEVGNLDSPGRARVDRCGLVALSGRRWSLDWWIGAEDRWHVPSREAVVRQSLSGAAPVVETRLRVPGGDAVHRVYAARDAAGVEALVVEVDNATTVPFAVALSIRPYDLGGFGGVHEVSVSGTEVVVDGATAVILPAAPRHATAAGDHDAADTVFAGTAGPPPASARSASGVASSVWLHPLAHTATLRIVLPLGPERPGPLPDAGTVVSGWSTHARPATRLEVPDRRLRAAIDASLRHALLHADDVRVAGALDRFGLHDAASPALLHGTAGSADALAELTEHWSVQRSPELAADLAARVAGLVTSLGRSGRDRPVPLRRRGSPDVHPSAGAASRARSIDRLALAAEVLDAAGEPRAAADVRATISAVAEPAAHVVAEAPAGSASEAGIARPGTEDPDPALTMEVARADLRAGRAGDAHSRLSWALGTASTTWTWPSRIPATDPAGGDGEGHEPAANAMLLLLVRDMLLSDLPAALELAPHVPPAWFGQGWEVHGAPTTHGRLSYAVRWHGDRPALLWELEPAGHGRTAIRAPLLDPGWSTDEPAGEALLSPVALPERGPRRGLSIPVTIEPHPRGR